MLTKTPRDIDGTFKSWETITEESHLAGNALGQSQGFVTGFFTAIGSVFLILSVIGIVFLIFSMMDSPLKNEDDDKLI
jgi:hypothetical protein